MYFINGGRRYGYRPVILDGRKKVHRVPTIHVNAHKEGDLLWEASETVCGRSGPWSDERERWENTPRRWCRDCLGWQQILEREAPLELRPKY